MTDRPSPSSDPALKALNLPDKFDVRFYTGSSNLTLNAQLQINELVGLYGEISSAASDVYRDMPTCQEIRARKPEPFKGTGNDCEKLHLR